MSFLKTIWFAIALALTLIFTTVFVGASLFGCMIIWKLTGVKGANLRRCYTRFIFRWSKRILAVFCELMCITTVFRFHRGLSFSPAIIIANHQSLVDILVLNAFLPAMGCTDARWVMKDSLGMAPLVGRACRGQGSAFISRGDRAGSERIIREKATLARNESASMVIFPEGTRFVAPAEGPAPDGGPAYQRLLPPRPSGFMTLKRAMPTHDLLIVTIDYGGRIAAKSIFQLGNLFGRTIFVSSERDYAPRADSAWLNSRWREMDKRLVRRTQED